MCRLIAISCLGLLIAPLAMYAQSDFVPPPITWCEPPSLPAERPEWARQDVYLRLAQDTTGAGAGPASSSAMRALHVAAVGLVLEGIRPYLVARAQLPPATPAAAPPGEPRYGPAALFTEVLFVLRGDGRLDTVYVMRHGDSTLAADLVASVREAAAAEPLLLTGDSAARHRFKLSTSTWGSEPGVARWRAFSLMAPREKPIQPWRMSPPLAYPEGLSNWRAVIMLQFFVEPDGRVNPETIRSLHPPPGYVWQSARQRMVFHRFLEEVRATLPRWRYRPAETGGCRVRQLAQQQFKFEVRR